MENNKKRRVRFLQLNAGEPRSGKTFAAEELADKYNKGGGGVVVYGVGMPTDFADFLEVVCLSPEETADVDGLEKSERTAFLRSPEIKYFEFSGNIYAAADFYKMFRRKKVQIRRVLGHSEQSIHTFFYRYLSGFLVIYDDVRKLTRQGLSKRFIEFLSRQNHAGEMLPKEIGRGCDILLIYHNPDKCPAEVIDYVTSFRLFTMKREPENTSDNDEIFSAITKSYQKLKTLPKYSSIYFEANDPEALKIIKP